MGTDERCMGWVKDEIGRAVGLPREIGGIPLDEIGATGFGLAVAAEATEAYCDVRLKSARVAIQGFSVVERHAARFLTERGAILVAASDSRGSIANPGGIDVAALTAVKAEGGYVTDLGRGWTGPREAVIEADCDILIPAARPDVITEGNAERIRARLIIEGANIPATARAEESQHRRGVMVVPDFIANAGGVISAAVEYHQGSEPQALAAIEDKIRRNTAEVLSRARAEATTPRGAATAMATE